MTERSIEDRDRGILELLIHPFQPRRMSFRIRAVGQSRVCVGSVKILHDRCRIDMDPVCILQHGNLAPSVLSELIQLLLDLERVNLHLIEG